MTWTAIQEGVIPQTTLNRVKEKDAVLKWGTPPSILRMRELYGNVIGYDTRRKQGRNN